MREYKDTEAKKLSRLICNGCGKIIPVKQGLPESEVFQVCQKWGYFSEKDGEIDLFDLCEECYDRITAGFVIPPEKAEVTEYL